MQKFQSASGEGSGCKSGITASPPLTVMFQSASGEGSGCKFHDTSTTIPKACFNPHPEKVPDVSNSGRVSDISVLCVSIRIRRRFRM